jgi:hypothetical protein
MTLAEEEIFQSLPAHLPKPEGTISFFFRKGDDGSWWQKRKDGSWHRFN